MFFVAGLCRVKSFKFYWWWYDLHLFKEGFSEQLHCSFLDVSLVSVLNLCMCKRNIFRALRNDCFFPFGPLHITLQPLHISIYLYGLACLWYFYYCFKPLNSSFIAQ